LPPLPRFDEDDAALVGFRRSRAKHPETGRNRDCQQRHRQQRLTGVHAPEYGSQFHRQYPFTMK
jgi:hypothetical protein